MIHTKKHNQVISTAKGIGITLMVIGHSGCPEYMRLYIYSFHMILFYFLSAYFFRDAKIVNDSCPFLKRKVQRLYWPYIKWSVVFILLHNFFYSIGFNDNLLTSNEMWINIKRSIRGMWQGEHFLGAYWFLISLFWETVIFSGIIWLKGKLVLRRLRHLDLLLVVSFFTIGVFCYYLKIDIWLNRELMVLPFFYLGYIVGNNRMRIVLSNKVRLLMFFVSILTLALVSSFAEISIGSNEYGPYLIYLVSSCCGIYVVLYISKLLVNYAPNCIKLFLDKLGEVTIQVMTFHFFCFKVLTLLLIYLYGYPSSYLLEWPVPKGLSSFWLLYSFVGIIGPWSFFYSYKRIQRTFLTSF